MAEARPPAFLPPPLMNHPPPHLQPVGNLTHFPNYTDGNGNQNSTLLIRHLPEAIPHDTLSRLLSHYGASSVRPCTHGRMKNCAFVDFKNVALASQAQQQLHGLRFLGQVLSVERASAQNKDDTGKEIENRFGSVCGSMTKDGSVPKDQRDLPKSNSSLIREPIAERLGVDYPFPPHLEYEYPPPDGNILTNIVNALIAVPRFYTQVLHLMNKMNIPAPFRMALPTPPLPSASHVPPPAPPLPPPIAERMSMEVCSSSESEMESSEEESPGVVGSKRKRIKRQTIIGPAIDEDVPHEAAGLKRATLLPKEIPLVKKNNPVLQIKLTNKVIQNEQMSDTGGENVVTPDKEDIEHPPYATVEEIKSGKLPPEEILSLSMFKNYVAGNPSPVLYIKNLAKDVVNDDFYFVFGSLFGSIDVAKSSLVVKLMQEGRMRGQAFITFPSVELAQSALNLVNGYVFKGKPMIIQFGRNPGAAKLS
ncbi:OLC1v1033206C1 [Oldenlandia corymbosa var. corymbosa]|uniref:OLC1v1033206C1 n=1 Tax=Oldenlandia corymbosa var. corymbosa TaxID=529605 RepID=A0AAV1CR08_OLDCO|nr:OLC1v1033206C1 [Oldenlandia corymbosa var. corymbosa]